MNEAVADADIELSGVANAELQAMLTGAKVRRSAVLLDRKRREAGLTAGCRLLGEYGPAPEEVAVWLRAQTQGEGKPWAPAAAAALGKLTGK
jgi:hypothetical protein